MQPSPHCQLSQRTGMVPAAKSIGHPTAKGTLPQRLTARLVWRRRPVVGVASAASPSSATGASTPAAAVERRGARRRLLLGPTPPSPAAGRAGKALH